MHHRRSHTSDWDVLQKPGLHYHYEAAARHARWNSRKEGNTKMRQPPKADPESFVMTAGTANWLGSTAARQGTGVDAEATKTPATATIPGRTVRWCCIRQLSHLRLHARALGVDAEALKTPATATIPAELGSGECARGASTRCARSQEVRKLQRWRQSLFGIVSEQGL